MAQVWVAVKDAARGTLPARCARSGQPCITRYARPVRSVPSLLEWLTWTSVWPLRRGQDELVVPLPLLPWRWRRQRTLAAVRDVTAALIVVLGVGAVVGVGAGGLLGTIIRMGAGVSIFVHLAVGFVGWWLDVELVVDVTGEWVRLSRVHPRFAGDTEARTRRPVVEPAVAERPGIEGVPAAAPDEA